MINVESMQRNTNPWPLQHWANAHFLPNDGRPPCNIRDEIPVLRFQLKVYLHGQQTNHNKLVAANHKGTKIKSQNDWICLQLKWSREIAEEKLSWRSNVRNSRMKLTLRSALQKSWRESCKTQRTGRGSQLWDRRAQSLGTSETLSEKNYLKGLVLLEVSSFSKRVFQSASS